MDAFKPFLQRLSQPIVLAFCISWIFWNWEIVVALLWYSAENVLQLKNQKGEAYSNHIAYINDLKDPWKNYWWPLIFAAAYPVIILLLNNFHTLVKKYEQRLFFRISRDANVPTNLLLDAQDEIEIKEKRISKFIQKETEMFGQIQDLEIANNELNSKIGLLSMEYKETKSILDELSNKFDSSNSKLEYIDSRSNQAFLLGDYNVDFMVYATRSELHSLLEADLKIRNNEDLSKIVLLFRYQNAHINSEVNEYVYDASNDLILLKLTRISSEFATISDNKAKALEQLDSWLHNDTVKISRLSASDDNMFTSIYNDGTNRQFRIDIERKNIGREIMND